MLEILSRPHPFTNATQQDRVCEGISVSCAIEYIVKKRDITGWYTQHIYVELNGIPIQPDVFDDVILRKTDHLVIQFCVPQGGGGGKDILRSVMMIAVAVGAMYFLGPGSTFALTYGTGTAAAAAAGVMIAGAMAVNALVPPTVAGGGGLGHKDSTEADVYSISGMRNQSRKYGALPMVLGFVRCAPIYGADPYTKLVGNDQYLVLDFLWSNHEVEIEDVKIDETLLTGYSDVETETNYSISSDTELGLYPNDIDTSEFSVKLLKDAETIKTTVADTDEISWDIVFSKGLCVINDDGNRANATVNVDFFYRQTGNTTWIPAASKTYTAKTGVMLRYNITKTVTAGQYDTKVVRTTADTDEDETRRYDDVVWVVLRSVKYQDPVTFDIPVAETQMIIKATDQLNGVVNSFNGLLKRVCLDYDVNTDKWVKRATQNPASLFRFVFQYGSAKPLTDDKLDLDALAEWHVFCTNMGYTYNKYHEAQMGLMQIINDICHAGRATYVRDQNVRSVVIDRERDIGPVQFYS